MIIIDNIIVGRVILSNMYAACAFKRIVFNARRLIKFEPQVSRTRRAYAKRLIEF